MPAAELATRAAPPTAWLSRFERLAAVGSTNDVVAGWLASGTPEVCVAVADEQTAGRGRSGRRWTAPPGAALLCSIGFRPTWLDPERQWRLMAIVSLAMADAAETTAGLARGTVRLKWPNDLVVADADAGVRKVAGVLGETAGLGTANPRTVVGIGVNVDWPAETFPEAEAATMTSLRELTGGPADRDALEAAFLDRLGPLVDALRREEFPATDWHDRQLTRDRPIRLEWPDGRVEEVIAVDVDPQSGALQIAGEHGATRTVLVGEIRHVRLAGA